MFLSVSPLGSLAPMFSSTSTLPWAAVAADHVASPTDASGAAPFEYRLGGTDGNGDGNVFLFFAAAKTSADFVLCVTPGPTLQTFRLPRAFLAHCTVDLNFEQAVRRRAAVPVDAVVWKLGIFRALQPEAAGFNALLRARC
jgi:hypothetical protein